MIVRRQGLIAPRISRPPLTWQFCHRKAGEPTLWDSFVAGVGLEKTLRVDIDLNPQISRRFRTLLQPEADIAR